MGHSVIRAVVVSTVGLVTITWGLLQTPYFEPSSRIIKSIDGSPYCLKINKFQQGDIQVRNYFSAPLKFLEFNVLTDAGYTTGKLSGFTYREKTSYRHNNLQVSEILQSCGSKRDENLLWKVEARQRECRPYSSSAFDNYYFFLDDFESRVVIGCYVNRSTGEYLPNCSFRGPLGQNWHSEVHFPSGQLDNWKVFYKAAKRRFKETVLPLDFCPTQIPLL